MNPLHFFTRAAAEQFEKNFTQFLVNNHLFQAFAHHSSKKAKDLANKVGEELQKSTRGGSRPDVTESMRRLVDNFKK